MGILVIVADCGDCGGVGVGGDYGGDGDGRCDRWGKMNQMDIGNGEIVGIEKLGNDEERKVNEDEKGDEDKKVTEEEDEDIKVIEEDEDIKVIEEDEDKKIFYGGCEGPNSTYIKLISCHDHEFIIKRKDAFTSNLIQAMMSSSTKCIENEKNEIHFKTISSYLLQKVCTYFTYNTQFKKNEITIDPEFPIENNIALDLLLVADFLDC
nr:elongin-C-like [Procambarus clarkii]